MEEGGRRRRRPFINSPLSSMILGAAVFAAAAAVLSWRAGGLRVTHAAPRAEGAGAESSLLPPAEVMGDWKPAGPPAVYVPKDLFELINGGADLVIEYGFRKLHHAEYRKASDPKIHLNIDLYDMGSAEGAFGLFSYERGDRPSNEAVGDEGVSFSASLAFRRGRFYVKIETTDLTGAAIRAARPIALHLASAIPGPPGKIEALERFPADGRVAGTGRLILHGPMGFESLGKTWLADYSLGGRKGVLFFSPVESAARAGEVLEHLRKEMGGRWTVEARPGSLSARAREGSEKLAVRAAGPCLLGFRGELGDSDVNRVLDSLQANILR